MLHPPFESQVVVFVVPALYPKSPESLFVSENNLTDWASKRAFRRFYGPYQQREMAEISGNMTLNQLLNAVPSPNLKNPAMSVLKVDAHQLAGAFGIKLQNRLHNRAMLQVQFGDMYRAIPRLHGFDHIHREQNMGA